MTKELLLASLPSTKRKGEREREGKGEAARANCRRELPKPYFEKNIDHAK